MDTARWKQLYTEHVDRLKKEYASVLIDHDLDRLVIFSGRTRRQTPFDDQDWPFRPTPFFSHWLPLREPNATLSFEVDGTLTLWRASHESYWESPPRCEVDFFWDELTLGKGSPASLRRSAFIGEPDDLDAASVLEIPEPQRNDPDLLASLESIRAIKSAYEVECIAEANRRAIAGHIALARDFDDGVSCELDLHLAYLKETRQDAWQTPYSNIVALGEHAAVLHHVSYSAEPRPASSLLVDAGASYLGYAADITRSWVRGDGEDARVFRGLRDLVSAAQLELCDELVVGKPYEELHDSAHRRLAKILVEVGIANGDPEELAAGGVTRAFFPHGLGHSLGIQVHDVGCKVRKPRSENAHLRTTVTVADGHVFTVEPGCYFIQSLLDELRSRDAGAAVDWSLVDRLRPFGGVRIEDNVEVRADGNRNLTRQSWPDRPR